MPPYGDEPERERPPRINDPPDGGQPGERDRTPPFRYVWQSVVERIVGYYDPQSPRPEVPRKLQPAAKFIAVVMSNKGNLKTGQRCTVGIPRLSVLTGYDERTCRESLGVLRSLGLLVRTRKGYANEHVSVPDEYKLAIPDDFLERVVMVDPHVYELPEGLVLQGAPSRRKKPKPGDDQAAAEVPGVTPATTEQAPVPATGHDTRDQPRGTGHDTRDRDPVPGVAPEVPGVTPTIYDRDHDCVDPNDITHSQSESHAARGPEVDQDPIRLVVTPLADARADPDPVRALDQPPPDRCDHGLPAVRRGDGELACPLCRRGLPASPPPDRLAPVIPLRRGRSRTA